MHPFPPIGMRILKTGISVALCLLLAYWLNQPPPVFACMAAIVVMRENLELSLHQALARILSTIVGCLCAIAIMFINAENIYLHILLVSLGCALTIYFCVLIKHPDTASLAAIIYLSLAISHPDDKYSFTLIRLTETIAGIVITIAVNAIIKRRNVKPQGSQEGGQDKQDVS